MADKAALITGGSSGIGLAVAQMLGQEGYGLTVVARRPEKLEQAAEQLQRSGFDVHHVAANMTDEGDIRRAVAEHEERYGRMDLLMNNAGVGIAGAIADQDTKRLDMQIDVNLRAVFLTSRESIPMLKKAGAAGGAFVINTASIAGKRPQGFLAAYSATKAAVIALTEALGKELAGDGVRCTAICPAFVDTPMTEWVKGQVKPEQMITTADVAAVVHCLMNLSPACIVPEVMMVRPEDYTSGDRKSVV